MASPVADSYSAASGATIYAGRSGLPAWVPAANTVATIPEANTFASIDPGNSAVGGYSYKQDLSGPYTGIWHKIIDDFSGGVYNPYMGPLGSMIYHGGGHAATNWNGIAAFDLSTLLWSIVMPGCTNCYPVDTTNGEYADGQPLSFHSYDGLAIIGPEAGYPKGALITVIMTAGAYEDLAGTSAAHIFDFAHPELKFVRLSANSPSWTFFKEGPATAYDPDLGRIWWVYPSNDLGSQQYYDLATSQQAFVSVGSHTGIQGGMDADSQSLRYDSARHLLICTDNLATVRRVQYFDTANPTAGWTVATLSTPLPAITSGAVQGFAFDKAADGTYLCNVQADLSKIYRLTIPATLTDAWPVAQITYAGDALKCAYVMGKRWSYIPALQSFVNKDTSANSHQIYRV